MSGGSDGPAAREPLTRPLSEVLPDRPDLRDQVRLVAAEVDLSREHLALLVDRAFRRQHHTLLWAAVALVAVDAVVAVVVAVLLS